jgi:hypothetical protein
MNEIVRTTEFDEKVLQITGTYDRMNDFDNALDWALCRTHIPDENVVCFNRAKGLYLWITDILPDNILPSFAIVYQVDEANSVVTLLTIEFSEKIAQQILI